MSGFLMVSLEIMAALFIRVKMFEIKLSRGAKPGKGGILPGAKVTKEIAAIRGIEEGATLRTGGKRCRPAEFLGLGGHSGRNVAAPARFDFGQCGHRAVAIEQIGHDVAADQRGVEIADGMAIMTVQYQPQR